MNCSLGAVRQVFLSRYGRIRYPTVVPQSLLVSQMLSRLALLFHEFGSETSIKHIGICSAAKLEIVERSRTTPGVQREHCTPDTCVLAWLSRDILPPFCRRFLLASCFLGLELLSRILCNSKCITCAVVFWIKNTHEENDPETRTTTHKLPRERCMSSSSVPILLSKVPYLHAAYHSDPLLVAFFLVVKLSFCVPSDVIINPM